MQGLMQPTERLREPPMGYMGCKTSDHGRLGIYLSIYGIDIAPLQGPLRSALSLGPGKKEGLKE